MIYVLIVTMHGLTCSSGCLTTAQFADRSACEHAAEEVHRQWSSANGVCVPYGSEKKDQ